MMFIDARWFLYEGYIKVLSLLAVISALYIQRDGLLRAEGLALIIITLLAGYTLSKLKPDSKECQTTAFDWLAVAFLIIPVGLIWKIHGLSVDLDQLTHLSILVIFSIAFLTQVRGTQALKAIAMLFIVFILVPSMDALETVLSYPMRRLSALLVYSALSPVDAGLGLSGTALTFSKMQINITEACDGLNLMQNLLWIIWLNGLVLKRHWKHQLVCFALKTPLVLVVNTARIFFLTALVWWEGPQILASDIHIYSGWAAVLLAAWLYLKIDPLIVVPQQRKLSTAVGASSSYKVKTTCQG